MRLRKLYINGYKKLRNVSIDFEMNKTPLSAYFFVGRNGSGKSSVLEALGLILTRVMQAELPDFEFLLQYECFYDNALVTIQPNPARISGNRASKLLVKICGKGKDTQQLAYLPDQYKPNRIVSYYSGSNGSMEDILFLSAQRALVSDMYDEIRRGNWGESLDDVMVHYQNAHKNPNTITVTDDNARFVAPLLFAFLPLGKNDGGDDIVQMYANMRRVLLEEVSGMIQPITCSLVFDEQRYRQNTQDGGNSFSSALSQLRKAAEENGWIVNREVKDNYGEPQPEELWVIPYSYCATLKGRTPYIECLCGIFNSDPLYCLAVLLRAHQAGILKTADLIYKLDTCEELFETRSLSDGELMWLTRMGLLLMAHCKGNVETLLLLDEPDAHFNDDWQIKFVSTLNDIAKVHPTAAQRCEYLISTHSSLILTDVKRDQLFLFEDTGRQSVRAGKTEVPSFGALREEISKKIFHTFAIGEYANKELDRLLETAQTPLELKPHLDEVGPGYQKLRLYDRYFELLQK